MGVDRSIIIGVVAVVLIVIAGIVGYYEGSRAVQPKTVTLTQTIRETITLTPTSGGSTPQYPASSQVATQTASATYSVTIVLPRNIGVIGGGATFVNPQMQAWIQRFMDLYKDYSIVINYQSIGSGAGEAKLIDGALDFAVTDVPISRTGFEKLKSRNIPFVQIPIVAGAVSIVYNLPEWDENRCGPLRLSGEVIADIYLGKIIKWNEPAIAQLQKDICRNLLPDKEIIGIHRADGSGTTYLFTAFLSIVNSEWNNKVGYGYTVEWPRDNIGYGIGAKGNEGVSATVKNTPYSIGYVEYGYAIQLGLKMAAIRNRDGNYVLPNTTTVLSALKYVTGIQLPKPDEYWGEYIFNILYREGSETYPIVGTPIMTLRLDVDPNKLQLIKGFLLWILTEGQKEENLVPGFLPLPKEFTERFIPIVESITK